MKWADVKAEDKGKAARVWADDGDYHMEYTGTLGVCSDGTSPCLHADDGEVYTFDDVNVELS